MPITGPASYVPTANQFISHWESSNLALGAGGPLVTEAGATIAILTGYRDQLDGFRDSVQDKLDAVEAPATPITVTAPMRARSRTTGPAGSRPAGWSRPAADSLTPAPRR